MPRMMPSSMGGMAAQMPMPQQGNNPWPHPMQGLEFLRGLIEPPPMDLNAFNDQGQFNPMGALSGATEMGGQLVGMADLPGKRQLAGMAGRMMNRGGDDLARAMGGFGDNASGTIRGNLPPVRGLDPGNLGAMDEMAPLGGGAPPSNAPNQAWNDMLPEHHKYFLDESQGGYIPDDPVDPWGNPGYPEGTSMGPGEVPPWEHSASSPAGEYERWSSLDMGPDDFANRDDWMAHQDYMQQGPPPGPMNFVASSGDPEMLIRNAALDMIQQGVSPAEAIQAATMQFSDLLRP